MTWSYDETLSTDKDKVRRLTGLTDTNNQRVSDEEISGVLTLTSNDVYETAALIADSLSGAYASRQDLKIDGFSVGSGNESKKWSDLAARIRRAGSLAQGGLGTPFVGGISLSEMDSVREDTDRNPSRFEVGMHNAPGTEPIEKNEYDEQN